MRRLGNALLVTVLMCGLVVTPVFAEPSVDELKDSKAAKESEVSSLQQQLTELMTKVSALESELISTGEEISKAEEDLTKAEKKEAEQYEAMKKRIKFLYEQGDASTLETLVGSSDFSDLLNKAEYVQNVHTYDREQLQDYIDTKKEVEELKSTLETEMSTLQSKEEEYTAKQDELSTTLASKESEVTNLDAQIQEAARAAVEAQQAQERQQAAARNDNSNNNSNNNSGSTSGGGGTSNGGSAPGYVPSTGNAVVDRARSQMGKPYSWGAVGPDAFDCSGLVSYALSGSYTRLGNTITFLSWPRVSDPQPGDVCVNKNHCGIYIGGGQMIHAPHSGAVVSVGPVQSSMVYVRY